MNGVLPLASCAASSASRCGPKTALSHTHFKDASEAERRSWLSAEDAAAVEFYRGISSQVRWVCLRFYTNLVCFGFWVRL